MLFCARPFPSNVTFLLYLLDLLHGLRAVAKRFLMSHAKPSFYFWPEVGNLMKKCHIIFRYHYHVLKLVLPIFIQFGLHN